MWTAYLEFTDEEGLSIYRVALLAYLYSGEITVCIPLGDLQDLEFEKLQEIIRFATKNGPMLKSEYEEVELHHSSQPVPPEKPKPGWIYLMKAENGYYKIGRCKNVPSRLKQLNREFPIKIEVVHQFWTTDYISREKDLHFLFKDQQQEGEWFALGQGDVETIMELQDEEPEPTS